MFQFKKPKVVFVCAHNSCRSQIAEAISKVLAGGVYEAYTAAVNTIREMYGVNMEESQRPKLLDEIAQADVVITMGCMAECPFYVVGRTREDWGLADPTGKGRDEFLKTARRIEENVLRLMQTLADV